MKPKSPTFKLICWLALAIGVIAWAAHGQTNVVPDPIGPPMPSKVITNFGTNITAFNVIAALCLAWFLRELRTIGDAGGICPLLWYALSGKPPTVYPPQLGIASKDEMLKQAGSDLASSAVLEAMKQRLADNVKNVAG